MARKSWRHANLSTWIQRCVRWALAGVFLYAGLGKLADPAAFAVVIDAFGILPHAWVRPVAVGLPALEVVAALALAMDIRGGLAAITGLLLVFIAILVRAIHMGLDIDCGCFGPSEPESRAFPHLRAALLRDMVLLAGVAILYGWRFRTGHQRSESFLCSLTGYRFSQKGGTSMRMRNTPATLVLVAALALTWMGTAWAEDLFEKEVAIEQSAVRLAREVQRGGYGLITTAELKQSLDDGKAPLLIDTMPYEDSYKKEHVPGARHFLFPIPDMVEWNVQETGGKTLEDFTALLGPDKDRPIVFYCGFVKCTRSHNGAAWAVKLGYKNVRRFSGGIYAWKGAGQPTEAEK